MYDLGEQRAATKSTTELGDDTQLTQLRKELRKRLVEGIDLTAVRTMDEDRLRRELRRGAAELCRTRAALISNAERERLVDELINDTIGLGPLEPLLQDPTVSDILINGPRAIYVEREGRLESVNAEFDDDDHLLEIVQRIAHRVGRRIDESSPMVDARLPDGSRVNAVIRPLALDGALVSIRRFGDRPLMAEDLITRQAAMPAMIAFLAAAVRARQNIIISGGTGSGKTTLLNMLSGFIADDERICTIEDAAELQLQQPHVARMESRPPNVEGNGEVTARDLVRNSLRMRPDRILIGECRGVEAFDMLQAMSTGHHGSLTTIHANDARDAISRLEMLVGMTGLELPLWFIHRKIATTVNLIVHVARLAGGSRKITQISEITGMEGEAVCTQDLFVFRQTGVNEIGVVQGHFEATGLRPICLPRLRTSGVPLSNDLFESRRLVCQPIADLQKS